MREKDCLIKISSMICIRSRRGAASMPPGMPEIPETVFEELLVNALVHRDYLVSAPIRIFIFDNRIEIISPGHLSNNLTVERIRAGISNIRNPILVSFVAKGLLPYHGLGSGIKRALDVWPDIEFADDREGSLFTVTVHRKKVKSSVKSSVKTEERILNLLKIYPGMTVLELAEVIGISSRAVEKQTNKLQEKGMLRRVGPKKGGYWEVIRKE
jgi:ATP-dependent DNA helicase RecG